MKILRHILTASISILLISCFTPDFSAIEGLWIAEGYNCEELTELSEDIKIEKKGDIFYAVKVTGDNCIPAGDTTWFGELKGDRIIGQIKGINPQTMEYQWIECEVFESIGFLQLAIEKNIILTMKRK